MLAPLQLIMAQNTAYWRYKAPSINGSVYWLPLLRGTCSWPARSLFNARDDAFSSTYNPNSLFDNVTGGLLFWSLDKIVDFLKYSGSYKFELNMRTDSSYGPEDSATRRSWFGEEGSEALPCCLWVMDCGSLEVSWEVYSWYYTRLRWWWRFFNSCFATGSRYVLHREGASRCWVRLMRLWLLPWLGK